MNQKPRTLEAALHLLADDVIVKMGGQAKKAGVLREYPAAQQAFNQLRDGIERARMGWTQVDLDTTEPGVVHLTFKSKYGELQVRWAVDSDLTRNDEA